MAGPGRHRRSAPCRLNRRRRPPASGRPGRGTRLGLPRPSVAYVTTLVGIPFFLAIAFNLSDVTAGDPSFDWVGLRNFDQIFADPVFWRSLRNTLVFTAVSMLLIVVFGKVLANILVADFRGQVAGALPGPAAMDHAGGAVHIAWLWLLDSVFSPIDWVLRELGLIQSNTYWLGGRSSPWPPSSPSTSGGWSRSPRSS